MCEKNFVLLLIKEFLMYFGLWSIIIVFYFYLLGNWLYFVLVLCFVIMNLFFFECIFYVVGRNFYYVDIYWFMDFLNKGRELLVMNGKLKVFFFCIFFVVIVLLVVMMYYFVVLLKYIRIGVNYVKLKIKFIILVEWIGFVYLENFRDEKLILLNIL